MKRFLQNFLILLLGLQTMTASLKAQNADNPNAATNPTILNAPAPPTPPNPPAPATQPNGNDDDHPPVRIGPTGIHVGGRNPVDIEAPNFGHNAFVSPGISVVMIVLISIVTPFLFLLLVIVIFFYARVRRQRLLHETLRAMIDKGVPIPPELITGPAQGIRKRADWDLRLGLVLVALGIGLLTLLGSHFGKGPGWIPVLLGIAFLAVWFIEKKQNKDTTNK